MMTSEPKSPFKCCELILCAPTGLLGCGKNQMRGNARIQCIRLVFWRLSPKAKRKETWGVQEVRTANRWVTSRKQSQNRLQTPGVKSQLINVCCYQGYPSASRFKWSLNIFKSLKRKLQTLSTNYILGQPCTRSPNLLITSIQSN